jgi:serine/threonine protein kinase
MRLGKYQLLRKLATGGMAEVFLAKTDGPMGFEKLLVIKRILPHLAEDPQFVAMFLGEAKLAAQLNHPNLVQIFDFGEAEGSYFIAMEYIDGPNLRLLVGRSREAETPIPFSLAARIVSQAAEGLAYAHDFRSHLTNEPLHLIHRDVSPDNILLSRSGAVKLVDFGIAKARGQSHHTQVGTVKGKVAYMAPEQLRGEPLDRRVDLYALGVVLYELCTGRMPFDANSDASMVRAVLYEAAIPATERVPDLPMPVQNILVRLLAKKREDRYANCGTLHADLERFIHQSGAPATAFVLSSLVARLSPPPVPVQPLPGQSVEQAMFTASAFAPTDPGLLTEPVVHTPPPLELKNVLQAGRPGASRSMEPVVGTPPPLQAERALPAGRTGVSRRGESRRPEGFVFPTALGEEREAAVEPVTLGLHRTDARRVTASMSARRPGRSGGAGKVIATLAVLLIAGAAGAWFGGFIPREHTALDIPPEGARADPSTPPAGTPPSSAATAPVAPAAAVPVTPPTRPGPPGDRPGATTGTAATTGAGTPAADAPRPAGNTPTVAEAPRPSGAAASTPETSLSGGSPPPAGESPQPNVPAAESPRSGGTASAAGAPRASSSPAAAEASGTASPAVATAEASRAGSRSVKSAAGPADRTPPAGAAARPVTAVAAAEPSTPSGGSENQKRERRESDKDRLLGAFAEAQAAADAPATIRLESTPKLRVRMGDRILGTTPLTISLPPQGGQVDLELFDTGLGLSRTESLTLKPGDNGLHVVSIPKGTLELKVPEGTAITVDGKSVGTAPRDPLPLYEGRHQVQLSKDDKSERRLITIKGGEAEVLEFDFPE